MATDKQMESAICSILTKLEQIQHDLKNLERKICLIDSNLSRQQMKELEKTGKCLSF